MSLTSRIPLRSREWERKLKLMSLNILHLSLLSTLEMNKLGMPKEPPNAEMDLTDGELKGQEMDLTVKQDSEEFLAESNFVTSGALYSFYGSKILINSRLDVNKGKVNSLLKIQLR